MVNVPRAASSLLVCLVLAATTAFASPFSDDLAARRARVMERLGPDTMLVLMSAPARAYSGDVDYEYRQDSNLYYLTGITQEQTTLVLMPGNASKREVLFVKDRNPGQEHWTGAVLSRDEARDQTGVSTVLSASVFDAFMSRMLSRRPYGATFDEKESGAWFAALGAGRARLALVIGESELGAPLTPPQLFLQKVRDRFAGFVAVDVAPELATLRTVKTLYEVQTLTRAVDISADAQKAGMRAAVPGAFEYQVKAAIEAVHRAEGAVSTAYPSIVASGPNATTLHYPQDGRQIQSGDLVLVDAAANFGYEAADITRTYPVSGTFTPAQRDIYELVLHAQEEAIKVAKPGTTLSAIHDRTVAVLKEGLLTLGLIADATGQQYAMWFTHGTSHFIGIDVHDVGSNRDILQPGMTFTIEPGLYIRQSVLDQLPATDANRQLHAALQAAVTKYNNIGVRIEDSFVMEAGGARSLSQSVPKSVKDVEDFMQHARAVTAR